MGTPHKALLRLPDGSTPASRLVAALSGAGCSPVVIAANDPAPYREMAVPVVADRRTGCGPLAGIEAALLATSVASVAGLCIVPGDQPWFDRHAVSHLIANWDGRLTVAWSERMQPLCAVMHAEVAVEISAALARGEHAVYRLWERLGATRCDFADARVFIDLDCPEDLARL
jgi:molybdopterin-guanine dinucleotide biosynthesis protein A